MPVNGVNSAGSTSSSDRNYLNTIGNKDNKNTAGKVYNAVFSDKDKDDLSINDFFDMMILQLTHQDFMNPVDDTQYLSQMAQFATMQEMMDLCQYSKQNYVMSMLGKEVTISKNKIGGQKQDTSGVVEKIMLQDGDYKIYVDGKPYDLNKVVQIGSDSKTNTDKTDSSDKTDDKTDAADKTDTTDDTVADGNLDEINKNDDKDKTETEPESTADTVTAEKSALADG